MNRLICRAAALLISLCLLSAAPARAEEDISVFDLWDDDLIEEVSYGDVEWDFPVDLSDMDPDLIRLANRTCLLPHDYEPDDLVSVKARKANKDGSNANGGMLKASGSSMKLRRVCAEALVAMSEAARAEGIYLYLKSAYRSCGTQTTMYNNRLVKMGRDDGWVIRPQASDHQTGLGCDVVSKAWCDTSMNEKFARTKEAQWMAAHCAEYGFILRYPEDKTEITGINFEPWHLRYVGIPAASYIMENGLCLEEFHDQLQAAIDEFIAAGGSASLVRPYEQVSAEDKYVPPKLKKK